jgi:hypothetical protein
LAKGEYEGMSTWGGIILVGLLMSFFVLPILTTLFLCRHPRVVAIWSIAALLCAVIAWVVVYDMVTPNEVQWANEAALYGLVVGPVVGLPVAWLVYRRVKRQNVGTLPVFAP